MNDYLLIGAVLAAVAILLILDHYTRPTEDGEGHGDTTREDHSDHRSS